MNESNDYGVGGVEEWINREVPTFSARYLSRYHCRLQVSPLEIKHQYIHIGVSNYGPFPWHLPGKAPNHDHIRDLRITVPFDSSMKIG